jgi:hypothetical protein
MHIDIVRNRGSKGMDRCPLTNTRSLASGCSPWRWYRGVGRVHMNRGRVGEERGGKEMDICPLTTPFVHTEL